MTMFRTFICCRKLIVVGVLLFAATGCIHAEPREPVMHIETVMQGPRFPNIVTATDGSILVLRAQRSPMQVRRSEDGGRTWGPIIQISEGDAMMGAAVVDENSGDILVFDHFFHHRMMYRSKDHGKTWQQEDVTMKPDRLGGVRRTHGADSGITLMHGEHKGRLILPARVLGPQNSNDRAWWPYHYNTAIFSDDGGKTWQTSHPFPVLGTGEAAIAELSDGTIYYNSRCHMADDAMRRIAWSHDGGMTWINPAKCEYLPDGMRGTAYGCMGGVVRLPIEGHDILIYSNLDSDAGHQLWGGRHNMAVWASFDGGRTWPVKRLVDKRPSAYSSLTAGRPDTAGEGLIFLAYEGSDEDAHRDIRVATFNLAWILDGRELTDFLPQADNTSDQ